MPHPDLHFDARSEAIENRHKSIYGESCEVCMTDTREIGRCDACSIVCGTNGQSLTIKRLDYFGG
jgi:hypothetical protein